MSWKSIPELVKDVKSGKTNAVELTEKALNRIDETADFNAVLRTNPEALKIAQNIDERIAVGEDVGPLAGVPYLAKDNYLTKDLETTAASNILKGYVPPYDSTVIKTLNQAGAILVGKTNLDSFAHGSSTENSDFGPTKNPVDPERVPGGSSGGSATAIALDMVPFALGTDTGGSIRQPASLCGVVGYKPTYGIVSRYGVVAMASSTDVMGPLTKTVDDTAFVLDVISKKDWHDSTMIDADAQGYLKPDQTLKGIKVGVVKEYFENLQPEVEASVRSGIDKLKQAGAIVDELELPTTKSALAIYYVVVSAEVSANLARYDGIRYGPRAKATDLDGTYAQSRSEGFNAENRRRITIGTYVLSSGYYDAYYSKAQKVRTLLQEDFNKAFDKYDILIGPTAPTTAFKLGEKDQDPVAMYMSDVMTVAASLLGLPAISIPCGKDESGLPIGVQLTAAQSDDRRLLGISRALEELL